MLYKKELFEKGTYGYEPQLYELLYEITRILNLRWALSCVALELADAIVALGKDLTAHGEHNEVAMLKLFDYLLRATRSIRSDVAAVSAAPAAFY